MSKQFILFQQTRIQNNKRNVETKIMSLDTFKKTAYPQNFDYLVKNKKWGDAVYQDIYQYAEIIDIEEIIYNTNNWNIDTSTGELIIQNKKLHYSDDITNLQFINPEMQELEIINSYIEQEIEKIKEGVFADVS